MGTSAKPSPSSSSRMARTRPSIMSDGATTSAPARAWLTAVRASSSTEASLSIVCAAPSATSTPQWPWSVYSQRQTSVTTSSSGTACLMARTASCTTPSSSQAEEPCSSFSRGSPKSSTAAMPSAAASRASSTAPASGTRSTPGMLAIDSRRSTPSATNSGSTSWPARRSVSRTSPRNPALARSLRMRVCGKAIASEDTCTEMFLCRAPAAPGAAFAVSSLDVAQAESRERCEDGAEHGEVREREGERRGGAGDGGVERLQGGLEGKDERDDADGVVEAGGDGSGGHEREERERQRE